VEKRDALPFGAGSWFLVDEANAGLATARERIVEVIDREADMMDSRTALRDELRDRRLGALRFEEFDERIASREPGDSGSVRIVERDFWHFEHVAVEREQGVQRLDGDPDVRDPGSASIRFRHWRSDGSRAEST
jgi:hypothetical protein